MGNDYDDKPKKRLINDDKFDQQSQPDTEPIQPASTTGHKPLFGNSTTRPSGKAASGMPFRYSDLQNSFVRSGYQDEIAREQRQDAADDSLWYKQQEDKKREQASKQAAKTKAEEAKRKAAEDEAKAKAKREKDHYNIEFERKAKKIGRETYKDVDGVSRWLHTDKEWKKLEAEKAQEEQRKKAEEASKASLEELRLRKDEVATKLERLGYNEFGVVYDEDDHENSEAEWQDEGYGEWTPEEYTPDVIRLKEKLEAYRKLKPSYQKLKGEAWEIEDDIFRTRRDGATTETDRKEIEKAGRAETAARMADLREREAAVNEAAEAELAALEKEERETAVKRRSAAQLDAENAQLAAKRQKVTAQIERNKARLEREKGEIKAQNERRSKTKEQLKIDQVEEQRDKAIANLRKDPLSSNLADDLREMYIQQDENLKNINEFALGRNSKREAMLKTVNEELEAFGAEAKKEVSEFADSLGKATDQADLDKKNAMIRDFQLQKQEELKARQKQANEKLTKFDKQTKAEQSKLDERRKLSSKKDWERFQKSISNQQDFTKDLYKKFRETEGNYDQKEAKDWQEEVKRTAKALVDNFKPRDDEKEQEKARKRHELRIKHAEELAEKYNIPRTQKDRIVRDLQERHSGWLPGQKVRELQSGNLQLNVGSLNLFDTPALDAELSKLTDDPEKIEQAKAEFEHARNISAPKVAEALRKISVRGVNTDVPIGLTGFLKFEQNNPHESEAELIEAYLDQQNLSEKAIQWVLAAAGSAVGEFEMILRGVAGGITGKEEWLTGANETSEEFSALVQSGAIGGGVSQVANEFVSEVFSELPSMIFSLGAATAVSSVGKKVLKKKIGSELTKKIGKDAAEEQIEKQVSKWAARSGFATAMGEAGSASFGIAVSRSYKQGIEKGMSHADALDHAVGVGVVQGLTSSAIVGAFGATGELAVLNKFKRKAGDLDMPAFAKWAKNNPDVDAKFLNYVRSPEFWDSAAEGFAKHGFPEIIEEGFDEGKEEAIQGFMDDGRVNWDQVIDGVWMGAGIGGAIGSGAAGLSGISSIIGDAPQIREQQINERARSIAEMVKQAMLSGEQLKSELSGDPGDVFDRINEYVEPDEFIQQEEIEAAQRLVGDIASYGSRDAEAEIDKLLQEYQGKAEDDIEGKKAVVERIEKIEADRLTQIRQSVKMAAGFSAEIEGAINAAKDAATEAKQAEEADPEGNAGAYKRAMANYIATLQAAAAVRIGADNKAVNLDHPALKSPVGHLNSPVYEIVDSPEGPVPVITEEAHDQAKAIFPEAAEAFLTMDYETAKAKFSAPAEQEVEAEPETDPKSTEEEEKTVADSTLEQDADDANSSIASPEEVSTGGESLSSDGGGDYWSVSSLTGDQTFTVPTSIASSSKEALRKVAPQIPGDETINPYDYDITLVRADQVAAPAKKKPKAKKPKTPAPQKDETLSSIKKINRAIGNQSAMLDTLKASGVRVIVAQNKAHGEALLGRSLSRKGTGVTVTDSDGNPAIVIFEDQNKRRSVAQIERTIFHEGVHAAQRVFAADNPELIDAASKAFDPRSPQYDKVLHGLMLKEYNGFDGLTPAKKVSEATRAIIEGKFNGRTSSPHFRRYLKKFLNWIYNNLDENPALRELTDGIESVIKPKRKEPTERKRPKQKQAYPKPKGNKVPDPLPEKRDYIVPNDQGTDDLAVAIDEIPPTYQKKAEKVAEVIELEVAKYGERAFPGGIVYGPIEEIQQVGLEEVASGTAMSVRKLPNGDVALKVDLGWLARSGYSQERIAVLLSEELIHQAALEELSIREAKELWRALPEDIKREVERSYFISRLKGVPKQYREDALEAVEIIDQEVARSESLDISDEFIDQVAKGTPEIITYLKQYLGHEPVDRFSSLKKGDFLGAHEFHRMIIQDKEFAGRVTEIEGIEYMMPVIIRWLKQVAQNLSRMITEIKDPETKAMAIDQRKRIVKRLNQMRQAAGPDLDAKTPSLAENIEIHAAKGAKPKFPKGISSASMFDALLNLAGDTDRPAGKRYLSFLTNTTKERPEAYARLNEAGEYEITEAGQKVVDEWKGEESGSKAPSTKKPKSKQVPITPETFAKNITFLQESFDGKADDDQLFDAYKRNYSTHLVGNRQDFQRRLDEMRNPEVVEEAQVDDKTAEFRTAVANAKAKMREMDKSKTVPKAVMKSMRASFNSLIKTVFADEAKGITGRSINHIDASTAEVQRKFFIQLQTAYRHAENDETRELINEMFRDAGFIEIGAEGEVVSADPGLHAGESNVVRGEKVRVIRPGWNMHDGVGEFQPMKAIVEPVEAATTAGKKGVVAETVPPTTTGIAKASSQAESSYTPPRNLGKKEVSDQDKRETARKKLQEQAGGKTPQTADLNDPKSVNAAVREMVTFLETGDRENDAALGMVTAHFLNNVASLKPNRQKAVFQRLKRMTDKKEGVLTQYAGETAAIPEVMQDTLETAKAMAAAGKSAKEIRAVTGWFPGRYDGKMRWEIPDKGASFKDGVSDSATVYNVVDSRGNEVSGYDDQAGADAEVTKLNKLDSGYTVRPVQSDYTRATFVSDILDHPELYEAYPDVGNVDLIITIGPDVKDEGGEFQPYENRESEGLFDLQPQITVRAKNKEDALSTLIHEIQHWIQEEEGFAKGGNFQNNIRNYKETVDDLNRYVMYLNEEMSLASKEGNKERYDYLMGERSEYVARIQEIEGPDGIGAAEKGFADYQRTAGEIEARDTQGRLTYDAKVRALVEPYDIENIAKEEAIILFSKDEHGDPQGFYDRSQNLIGLIQGKANESTIMHEVAHMSRELLKGTDLGSELNAAYGIATDEWTDDQEEVFARHVERYMRDGDFPDGLPDRLKAALAKVAEVIRGIYAQLAGSPIHNDIPAEVRKVLDEIMLLGEEKATAPEPKPDLEVQPGMTGRERAELLEPQLPEDPDMEWIATSGLKHGSRTITKIGWNPVTGAMRVVYESDRNQTYSYVNIPPTLMQNLRQKQANRNEAIERRNAILAELDPTTRAKAEDTLKGVEKSIWDSVKNLPIIAEAKAKLDSIMDKMANLFRRNKTSPEELKRQAKNNIKALEEEYHHQISKPDLVGRLHKALDFLPEDMRQQLIIEEVAIIQSNSIGSYFYDAVSRTDAYYDENWMNQRKAAGRDFQPDIEGMPAREAEVLIDYLSSLDATPRDKGAIEDALKKQRPGEKASQLTYLLDMIDQGYVPTDEKGKTRLALPGESKQIAQAKRNLNKAPAALAEYLTGGKQAAPTPKPKTDANPDDFASGDLDLDTLSKPKRKKAKAKDASSTAGTITDTLSKKKFTPKQQQEYERISAGLTELSRKLGLAKTDDEINALTDLAGALIAGAQKLRKEAGLSEAEFSIEALAQVPDKVRKARGRDTLKQVDEERDREYLAAVEAGDLNTVERLIDEAAKEAGYNIGPAYHGTSHAENIEVFNDFSYFTDDWWNADGYASGERVYDVYLKMETPLVIDAKGEKWDELSSEHGSSTQDVVRNFDDTKYDGIIFEDIGDSWMDDAEAGSSTVYVTTNPNQIKSADPVTYDKDGEVIPLSQRFDSDKDSILYQFAGENAEVPQFMADSLETAKAMAAAGRDSETIRAATGWFPGKYDGKMRWEIPDEGAKIYDEVLDLLKNGDTEEVELRDLLDHTALFEAYPEIGKIPVSLKDGIDAVYINIGGKERISIGAQGRGLSSLLHEIQHAIQHREGFARGSSPLEHRQGMQMADEDFDRLNKEVSRKFMVTKYFESAEENGTTPVEELRKRHELRIKHAEELAEKYKRRSAAQLDAENAQLAAKKYSRLADREIDPRELELTEMMSDIDEAREWYQHEKEKYEKEREKRIFAPDRDYRRTAGEIEARDVQSRANLTAEQRAAIAPYSSENIAPEDAILLQRGGKGRAIKGFYRRADNLIGLIEGKADAITLLHEIIHLDRELLKGTEIGNRLNEFYGEATDDWSPESEEKFAEHAEEYFRRGKFPQGASDKIKEAFRVVKEIARNLYAHLKGELPNEIRDIFDEIIIAGSGDHMERRSVNDIKAGNSKEYVAERDKARAATTRERQKKAKSEDQQRAERHAEAIERDKQEAPRRKKLAGLRRKYAKAKTSEMKLELIEQAEQAGFSKSDIDDNYDPSQGTYSVVDKDLDELRQKFKPINVYTGLLKGKDDEVLQRLVHEGEESLDEADKQYLIDEGFAVYEGGETQESFPTENGIADYPNRPAVDAEIAKVATRLSDNPGSMVSLGELVPIVMDQGFSKREVEDGLYRIYQRGEGNLTLHDQQSYISDSEREFALKLGVDDMHLFAIGRRAKKPSDKELRQYEEFHRKVDGRNIPMGPATNEEPGTKNEERGSLLPLDWQGKPLAQDPQDTTEKTVDIRHAEELKKWINGEDLSPEEYDQLLDLRILVVDMGDADTPSQLQRSKEGEADGLMINPALEKFILGDRSQETMEVVSNELKLLKTGYSIHAAKTGKSERPDGLNAAQVRAMMAIGEGKKGHPGSAKVLANNGIIYKKKFEKDGTQELTAEGRKKFEAQKRALEGEPPKAETRKPKAKKKVAEEKPDTLTKSKRTTDSAGNTKLIAWDKHSQSDEQWKRGVEYAEKQLPEWKNTARTTGVGSHYVEGLNRDLDKVNSMLNMVREKVRNFSSSANVRPNKNLFFWVGVKDYLDNVESKLLADISAESERYNALPVESQRIEDAVQFWEEKERRDGKSYQDKINEIKGETGKDFEDAEEKRLGEGAAIFAKPAPGKKLELWSDNPRKALPKSASEVAHRKRLGDLFSITSRYNELKTDKAKSELLKKTGGWLSIYEVEAAIESYKDRLVNITGVDLSEDSKRHPGPHPGVTKYPNVGEVIYYDPTGSSIFRSVEVTNDLGNGIFSGTIVEPGPKELIGQIVEMDLSEVAVQTPKKKTAAKKTDPIALAEQAIETYAGSLKLQKEAGRIADLSHQEASKDEGLKGAFFSRVAEVMFALRRTQVGDVVSVRNDKDRVIEELLGYSEASIGKEGVEAQDFISKVFMVDKGQKREADWDDVNAPNKLAPITEEQVQRLEEFAQTKSKKTAKAGKHPGNTGVFDLDESVFEEEGSIKLSEDGFRASIRDEKDVEVGYVTAGEYEGK